MIKADFSKMKMFGDHVKAFTIAFPVAVELDREEFTQELLTETKRRASGRPGPNVVTGKYRNAFYIAEKRVVNDSPQTRRLEYGFSGADSLGRQYTQPPFPHMRPALLIVTEKFKKSLPKTFRETWRDT
jgi:hypothetical protein